MRAYVKNKLKRFNRLNNRGGIEGLPMELMIIVVVATIGCGVVVGWMGSIDEPESIGDVESSMDQIILTSDTKTVSNLKITVLDSDGDPIRNATVVLSGCGVKSGSSSVSPCVVTDQNGVATFSSLSVTKIGSGVGYITVSVSAEDYGEETIRIPVVR